MKSNIPHENAYTELEVAELSAARGSIERVDARLLRISSRLSPVIQDAVNILESSQSCPMISSRAAPVLSAVIHAVTDATPSGPSRDVIVSSTSSILVDVVPDEAMVWVPIVAYFCDSRGILTINRYPRVL